jgi:hypothetical protein
VTPKKKKDEEERKKKKEASKKNHLLGRLSPTGVMPPTPKSFFVTSRV